MVLAVRFTILIECGRHLWRTGTSPIEDNLPAVYEWISDVYLGTYSILLTCPSRTILPNRRYVALC